MSKVYGFANFSYPSPKSANRLLAGMFHPERDHPAHRIQGEYEESVSIADRRIQRIAEEFREEIAEEFRGLNHVSDFSLLPPVQAPSIHPRQGWRMGVQEPRMQKLLGDEGKGEGLQRTRGTLEDYN